MSPPASHAIIALAPGTGLLSTAPPNDRESQTMTRSEIRDGMQIDWDAPIEMDDGIVLRADVFRPVGDGRHPVILTYGPYAKGAAFQEKYKSQWDRLIKAVPDVLEGSS